MKGSQLVTGPEYNPECFWTVHTGRSISRRDFIALEFSKSLLVGALKDERPPLQCLSIAYELADKFIEMSENK